MYKRQERAFNDNVNLPLLAEPRIQKFLRLSYGHARLGCLLAYGMNDHLQGRGPLRHGRSLATGTDSRDPPKTESHAVRHSLPDGILEVRTVDLCAVLGTQPVAHGW